MRLTAKQKQDLEKRKAKKPLTEFQLKALEILKNTTIEKPIKAAEFARKMWPESYMHTKTSNQGNGACSGKAAWLCGGAYLRKLQMLGLVEWHDFGYYISAFGKQKLQSTD